MYYHVRHVKPSCHLLIHTKCPFELPYKQYNQVVNLPILKLLMFPYISVFS